MKQKLCILFFFGLICLGLQAQTHVVLKTKAGGIQNIGLNKLRNVTFTEDNIIFNYASGSNLPYAWTFCGNGETERWRKARWADQS